MGEIVRVGRVKLESVIIGALNHLGSFSWGGGSLSLETFVYVKLLSCYSINL